MQEYLICPVPKPRMVRSDKWKKRKATARYWAFKDHVRSLNIDLPIPCKVTFYIPMPPSWSKKKREAMNGQPHMQSGDCDNFLKALLDCLYCKKNKTGPKDDSHVWSIWVEKRWRDRGGIRIEKL